MAQMSRLTAAAIDDNFSNGKQITTKPSPATARIG